MVLLFPALQPQDVHGVSAGKLRLLSGNVCIFVAAEQNTAALKNEKFSCRIFLNRVS